MYSVCNVHCIHPQITRPSHFSACNIELKTWNGPGDKKLLLNWTGIVCSHARIYTVQLRTNIQHKNIFYDKNIIGYVKVKKKLMVYNELPYCQLNCNNCNNYCKMTVYYSVIPV